MGKYTNWKESAMARVDKATQYFNKIDEEPQFQQQNSSGQNFPQEDNETIIQDNIKIEKNANMANYKEENDLPSLLKRIEHAVHSGGENSENLISEWIQEKEKKIKWWRKGLRSGAAVQTFGLGIVTFGFGPIPINISIIAFLYKHIVHTFTLDDERVDNFVKSTLGYGAADLAKKLGMLFVKSAIVVTGTTGATGLFFPFIGPAISAGLTSHTISKKAKKTTKSCAELSREICERAIQTNNFNI